MKKIGHGSDRCLVSFSNVRIAGAVEKTNRFVTHSPLFYLFWILASEAVGFLDKPMKFIG